MSKTPFTALNLTPKIERAIAAMGFETATPVQAQAIPLIRTGEDVIARSQTGTGKTVAFAIPAIERIDTKEEKNTVQVLILCPTRELAQQAGEEIRKVARFKTEIHPVEIYGGATIDKQCVRLRKANIVIGTPGRIMDHMRRKTLVLDHLKMVVLDEADEMLNMGFKEDIETILQDAPAERQTVLFSATMPPAILKLTRTFQRNPQLIEIDKGRVTIDDIDQSFLEIPHDKKKEALSAILSHCEPKRAIIFCNTKRMVDDLAELLNRQHFRAASIHSDLRQSQRTAVMNDFKQGKTAILLATDIAARGIDVNDIDFVINYDIPMNAEYYVHRIGRTGRAGKSGRSVTLCSGRRELNFLAQIARDVKSEITPMKLPSAGEVKKLNRDKLLPALEKILGANAESFYGETADALAEGGHSYRDIAAAALQYAFSDKVIALPVSGETLRRDVPRPDHYETLQINIGSTQGIAVNHIVGAVTERTAMSGREIGKVKIFPLHTLVEVPAGHGEEVLKAMKGCKIRGVAVHTERWTGAPEQGKPARNSHSKGKQGKGGAPFQQKKARSRRG